LFSKEKTELADAEDKIGQLNHMSDDVGRELKNILDAVSGLARLRDEGQALNAKTALQRKVGVLSAN